MRQGKGAMNGRKFLAKGKKKKRKKKKKKLRYRDLSQFYWNANERQQRVIIRRKEDWRDTSGVTRIFDPKPARLSRRR